MTDLQYNVPDDSNLAQCEYCGWVVDWDEVPRARDLSGEIVTCCEECNEGESFVNYPSKDQGKNLSKQERVEMWEEAHRKTIGLLFERGYLEVV